MKGLSMCVLGVILAGGILELPSARAGDAYVYHRDGWGEAGSLEVDFESAVGTREVRPFGEEGMEAGARVRYRLTDRVLLEAWGGTLFQEGAYRNGSALVRGAVGVLSQKGQGIDLTLGAGIKRDFADVVIPEVRLTASRRFGLLDVTASALAEVPLAEERDAVDLIAGVAASYQLSEPFAVGLEVIGEDLEGFWEEDEAEGGAKLVAGPTVYWRSGARFSVKANAGLVALASSPQVDVGDEPTDDSVGALGRVILAYTF